MNPLDPIWPPSPQARAPPLRAGPPGLSLADKTASLWPADASKPLAITTKLKTGTPENNPTPRAC